MTIAFYLLFDFLVSGMMEQVKGVSYSLGEFLGPAYWRNGPEVRPAGQTEMEYEKSLLVNKENDLFHCVIYLAPGRSNKSSLTMRIIIKSDRKQEVYKDFIQMLALSPLVRVNLARCPTNN